MSPRTGFLTWLALALLVAGILVAGTRRPHPREDAVDEPVAVKASAPSGHPSEAAPPAAREAIEAMPPRTVEEPAAEPPPERPLSTVRVDVRDEQEKPVPGASVQLSPDGGPHVAGLDVPDSRNRPRRGDTDPQGSARFGGVPAGMYELSAWKEARRVRLAIAVTPGRTSFDLVLPAASADLLVRVVDTDGRPVPDATVELFGVLPAASGDATRGTPEVDAQGHPAESATDERGIARFAGVEFEGGVAVATAKDGRAGQALTRREDVERALRSGGMRIVVAATGVIEGELRGLPPDRLAGARVLAYALDNANPYWTTHGRGISTRVGDGHFRFEGLAAGTWTLSFEGSQGGRVVLPPRSDFGGLPNSVDPIVVNVEPGRTVVQDLDVREGGTVEGIVRTSDGTPVRNAQVLDTFAPETSNVPDGFLLRGVNVWRFDARERGRAQHPETHPHTRTDEQGRYRLAGLQPGKHRVEVIARGLSYDRREGVVISDGETNRLEHVLERAGAIQGADPRGGYLGITRAGEAQPLMIAILPGDGRFAFAGLAPGRYVLGQFHSDDSLAPVPLFEAAVEAGRTTWVDLAAAARPVRIGGRVVGAHGPVAGVHVTLYPETLVTDASGRFETRVSFAHTMWVRLRVRSEDMDTEYQFPGMPAGAVEWNEDVVLGRESLLVRTLDDRGMPARARLDVNSTGITAPRSHVQSVRASRLSVDESGERAIGALPTGTYSVCARFESGAEIVKSISLPASEPLVLREPASGVLVVVATLRGGGPASGRAVCVRTAGESDSTREAIRWTETDAEGRARIRGVTAGDLKIELVRSRGGFGGFDGVLASEALHLARDEERTVSFVLENP